MKTQIRLPIHTHNSTTNRIGVTPAYAGSFKINRQCGGFLSIFFFSLSEMELHHQFHAAAAPDMVFQSVLWAYRPLPYLFLVCFLVWSFLICLWVFNTWSKRHLQNGKLQLMLTVVPVMKALVLGLSFLFWYSCIHLSMCSFWVAFGVFVTRIFLEIACFVSFLLIAHGYCIMHEELTSTERRSIAGLVSLLYLSLTGYKAAVPQFGILIMAIYALMLYMIFFHLSRNISLLREQMQRVEENDVQSLRAALYIKYTMFRKFQVAMLIMVISEILTHIKLIGVPNSYWIHLLMRESTEIAFLFYIGWTFRSRELSPFFSLIPSNHSSETRNFPPIFSVEMNENDFNNLNFREWHIGVRTSQQKCEDGEKPVLVVVQHPSAVRTEVSETVHKSKDVKASSSRVSISHFPFPRNRSFVFDS